MSRIFFRNIRKEEISRIARRIFPVAPRTDLPFSLDEVGRISDFERPGGSAS